jgi:hypothetical protein
MTFGSSLINRCVNRVRPITFAGGPSHSDVAGLEGAKVTGRIVTCRLQVGQPVPATEGRGIGVRRPSARPSLGVAFASAPSASSAGVMQTWLHVAVEVADGADGVFDSALILMILFPAWPPRLPVMAKCIVMGWP